MEISTSSNIVKISGSIKTINDHQSIKKSIDELTASNKSITVVIEDSISITSSVIGYFNKLVLKDKIDLHLQIGAEQLMTLLDDLHLTKEFKARRI